MEGVHFLCLIATVMGLDWELELSHSKLLFVDLAFCSSKHVLVYC